MYTYKELDVDYTMLAGRSQRLVNIIIDTIAYAIVLVLLRLIAPLLYYMFDFDALLIWVTELSAAAITTINIAVLVVYYVLMEWMAQRTLGKFVSGTKVVLADGTRPGLGAILLRTACRYIPLEVFSVFGEAGRMWHDSIPNTYVIDVVKYSRAVAIKSELHDIGSSKY